MKQIFLYCGIMLLFAGTVFFFYYRKGQFNNVYGELHNRLEESRGNNDRLDSGKWYSNKWEMYHTLSFERGNTVTIDNHVDTILRYQYNLDGNILWLINKKDSVANKVKIHSDSELVFESFLDEKKELRYTRTKK